MDRFFSFAKLILMGEYAVLHGADALCLPLKTGQQLFADDLPGKEIHWQWVYRDEVLTSIKLNSNTLEIIDAETGDASWPVALIKLIRQQNPSFLRNKGCSLRFVNYFPASWGLGSSSATISSICRMAKVNPYVVNRELTGGSGADIACTTAQDWFLYRNKLPTPGSWEVPVDYIFADHTYFIYSGKKQATRDHLDVVGQNQPRHYVSWLEANKYIYRFISASTLPELMKIIHDHELLIQDAIGVTAIGTRFPDFPGKLKSLGAWGGDFFMAVTQQDEVYVRDYFSGKGFHQVFTWDQLTATPSF